MRIVFLGNHTVGVTVLDTLRPLADVTAVVAHPPDPEDGTVYQSVHDAATAAGIPVLRGRGGDEAVRRFVADARPDLLWITDYRYLIPAEMIALAPRGAVNLHPSLLPRYRGRAPINWAILHGETELGLTAHFVDDGMDTGDVIAQRRYTLGADQDVGDALALLYPLYRDITEEVLGHFRSGRVPRTPQDHALATAFPRRTPEDGGIDWRWPRRRVLDLVRAVARPYPGAISSVGGIAVKIWKASPEAGPHPGACPPGSLLPDDGKGPRVCCGDGPLRLLDVDPSRLPGAALPPGTVFDILPSPEALKETRS